MSPGMLWRDISRHFIIVIIISIEWYPFKQVIHLSSIYLARFDYISWLQQYSAFSDDWLYIYMSMLGMCWQCFALHSCVCWQCKGKLDTMWVVGLRENPQQLRSLAAPTFTFSFHFWSANYAQIFRAIVHPDHSRSRELNCLFWK